MVAADGVAVEAAGVHARVAVEDLAGGGSRSVLVGARLPVFLRDGLASRAAVSDRSFSAELRRAVSAYLVIDDVTVSALLRGDHGSKDM